MAYDATQINFNRTASVEARRNAVRFLIRDTSDNPTFSDDEIDAILGHSANVYDAAIRLAGLVTGSSIKRRRVGRTDIEYFGNSVPRWLALSQSHKGPGFVKAKINVCPGS